LRSPAKSKSLSAAGLVEVKPLKMSASEAIEICLSGERRLLVRRGFDRDLLIDPASGTRSTSAEIGMSATRRIRNPIRMSDTQKRGSMAYL
jgi:hypothetical protein